MNRIDRLQAILTTLQSKRIVTAEALAKKYEVSLRTIYRDIRSLEEGGVPIGAEAGIGYYIPDGYSLPPVMFTHAEARALMMAGKVIEKMSDEKTSKVFAEALTKISAVVDTSKKEEMEDLAAKIIVNPFPEAASVHPQELVLDKIKEALVKSVKVSFAYTSNGKGEITSRTIDPIGLCYYGHFWHLIGFCHLRNDYRDFRTDKISSFTLCHERFRSAQYPSLKQYMDRLICETELVRVVIKVQPAVARQISGTRYTMGYLSEKQTGDWIEMEFATWSTGYFARWMLMMGNKVQVVEPAELVDQVKEIVKQLQEYYQTY